MNIDDYLEQEARCRRLATQASNRDLKAQLLQLADEYADAAAVLESDGPKPELPLANNQS